MAEKKGTKRRTQVKDLPQKEKRLGKEEQKKVKGGYSSTEDAVATDSFSLNYTKTAQKVRGS